MARITHLLDGFRRFQQQLYGDNERLAAKLARGQSPQTLVIACSDSRVDPALLTDCAPGDIFTVRNVANLVPPYEPDNAYHGVSAALEYAVCSLKVKDIIVLGHSGCGGIAALLSAQEEEPAGEFVGRWVEIAAEARTRSVAKVAEGCSESLNCICEQEAILTSLENLQTFPWLRERLADQSLELHGWYFQIETGRLLGYRQEQGEFEEMVPAYSGSDPAA